MPIDASLLRLALGIPFAGVGGLLGYLTAPKAHRAEGVARGAGMGYFTGTGLGLGSQLGEHVSPEGATPSQTMPYSMAGGLGGAALGLGVGKMFQGEPEYEKKRKFREELLNLLKEEKESLRNEVRGIQKVGEETRMLSEIAGENPETVIIPASALVGGLATKKRRPVTDFLRGSLIGAGTGAGAVVGGTLGKRMAEDNTTGMLTGGGIGALLGYLALRKLLRSNESKTEKRGISSVLQGLIDAKALSDVRQYSGKHHKLRQLMEQYPDDFYIDSVQGDIVGITHTPTGFKIHSPIGVVPTQVRGTANVASKVAA